MYVSTCKSVFRPPLRASFRLLWAFSPRRWSKQLRNTYLVSSTRSFSLSISSPEFLLGLWKVEIASWSWTRTSANELGENILVRVRFSLLVPPLQLYYFEARRSSRMREILQHVGRRRSIDHLKKICLHAAIRTIESANESMRIEMKPRAVRDIKYEKYDIMNVK